MALQEKETLLVEDPLTETELRDSAEKLSELIGNAEELEDEKKQTVADLNLKIKEIEAEASDLAQVVRQGYQVRPVECEIVYDYPRKVKRYYRIDNQDLVETRNLSAAELQGNLFEGKEGE